MGKIRFYLQSKYCSFLSQKPFVGYLPAISTTPGKMGNHGKGVTQFEAKWILKTYLVLHQKLRAPSPYFGMEIS